MVISTQPIPRIRLSDRIAFFGRTGSGKSTKALGMLKNVPRFVVLDPKWEIRIPGVPVSSTYRSWRDKQIIRAPIDKEELEHYDSIIDSVWKDGNPRNPRVLYIDELTLINSRSYLRPSLGRAIRTGRSRGVAVWSASQRPKDIPSAVFTECEHFYTFQLTYEDDRRKVSAFTNDIIRYPLATLRDHDFIYYGIRDDYTVIARVRG